MAPSVTEQRSMQAELINLKNRPTEGLTKQEALALAIQAAELQMKFMRLAVDKDEKAEFSNQAHLLLTRAERIKQSEDWTPHSSELLIDLEPLEPICFAALPPTTSFTNPNNPPATKTSKVATEQLPVSQTRRELSKEEQLLIVRGSNLNGHSFVPWDECVDSCEISTGLMRENAQFVDKPRMQLSVEQESILSEWMRPSEALPPPSWSSILAHGKPFKTIQLLMKARRRVDLVQDAATDCSVVASLCAAIARTEKGHNEILTNNLHPYNAETGVPLISLSGKYIVRLNFNGCYRKVVIDDLLPVSKTPRTLHVVDRNNPTLLWPALIEKAYLKVRGGYDFPGSNSGTDLWVLTGWIPQQVFLQHNDCDLAVLWKRVHEAFVRGDVLVSIGTGKITQSTERELGLVSEHDYAVLDIKEVQGRKCLLVKNPWHKGVTWKGHRPPVPGQRNMTEVHDSDTDDEDWQSVLSVVPDGESLPASGGVAEDGWLSQGTFWMTMSDVVQNFESIYLNWNPVLFSYRQELHFNWDITIQTRSPAGCVNSNPQYVVRTSRGGRLWVLLDKHLTSRRNRKNAASVDENQGFISLQAYVNQGQHVYMSKNIEKRGPYVDSPQTLLCLEPHVGTSYTVVVSEQDLPPSLHTFTLSAFSDSPVSLYSAPWRYAHRASISGSWTSTNAGGNAGSVTYSHNPQYSLTLPSATPLALYLETRTSNLNIHIKLVHGRGQRVFSVAARDIVVDSGDYRRGCALADLSAPLGEGIYTIICSNFTSGEVGDFTLQVNSNVQAILTAIPREGGGRLKTRLADASFGVGVRCLAAPIKPRRLARVNLVAQHVTPLAVTIESAKATWPKSPLRLSIELGRGPNRQILISSEKGMFSDAAGGIRTEDLDLQPDQVRRYDMWLVLERLAGVSGMQKPEERVSVEFFSDVQDPLAIGVWREWEKQT